MAVFYLEDDCGDAIDGPKCADYGRKAHQAITQFFHLKDADLPLLRLDPWNWNQPFSYAAS